MHSFEAAIYTSRKWQQVQMGLASHIRSRSRACDSKFNGPARPFVFIFVPPSHIVAIT